MLRTRSLVVWISLCLIGCTPPPTKSSGTSPEKKKDEGALAFTDLSKKAYAKLEIRSQKIVAEDVQERLALTGWVMAKPGNEVTLTAPTAGYVHFLNQHAPIAGESVKAKAELLQLQPVLSPVEQIQVASLKRSIESEFVKAQTTLKNAEIEYTRAVELKTIRSKQELEQAKKALDFAKEEEAAAKDKQNLFESKNIVLSAPQAGTILQLHVGPGQYVPVSAPLLTIIDLQPVWIRVPVPEFDLPLVDPRAEAEITLKNPNHGRTDVPPSYKAKPTGRVAQVDPVKHTADFWYELGPASSSASPSKEKADTAEPQRFVKDQMVTVRVPLGKKEKATVVPTSAVIYDAHGHAWIYLEVTKDGEARHRFERRPVEVVAAVSDGLMLRTQVLDGDRVVTNGAAVLFSRDFHKTPVKIDGEDD